MKRFVLLGSALLVAMSLSAAQAKKFQVLHSFAGSDGAYPNGNLLLDKAGNLWGTTQEGGNFGHGTIFKLSPGGEFSLVYSFTGGTDGGAPMTGVTIDPSTGDLYGTTVDGGRLNCGGIFRLTAAGDLTVLHDFDQNKEGDRPASTLVRDLQGNLYGTLSFDGPSDGVIFELTAAGKFQILYAPRGTNGSEPFGRLARNGSDFYGINNVGGSGSGTIFKVGEDGTFKTLYTPNLGVGFAGGLARDDAGNLYGAGGWEPNGSIYALSSAGAFSMLYTFTGGGDGRFPGGDMLLAKGGDLYGATSRGGGSSDDGTVFKLDPKGSLTVLHAFSGDDGATPNGGLVQGKKRKLYGTAYYGGSQNLGVVFAVKAK